MRTYLFHPVTALIFTFATYEILFGADLTNLILKTFHFGTSVSNVREHIAQQREQQRNVFGHQFRYHRFTNGLNQNLLFGQILCNRSFVYICFATLRHRFLYTRNNYYLLDLFCFDVKCNEP